jgi:hypothetical protein
MNKMNAAVKPESIPASAFGSPDEREIRNRMRKELPANKAPRVRQWLEAHYPERYVAIPHGTALRLLYSTPRVYKSSTELVDPNRPEKVFDLMPLQQKYKAG